MLAIELARLTNWGGLPLADATLLFEEPELNEVMRWANTLPLAEQTELLEALPDRLPGWSKTGPTPTRWLRPQCST